MGSRVHPLGRNEAYANMPAGSDKDWFMEHNPYGVTVSQARYTLQNQLNNNNNNLEAAVQMQGRWRGVPFDVPYEALINDTGEDIPGLRTYESLGMENRPLENQFGSQYDMGQITDILSQYSDVYTNSVNTEEEEETSEGEEEEESTTTDTTTDTTTTPEYLTADDLTTWWDDIDKSSWGNSSSSSSNSGMTDFMRFMMFMNMMQPQSSISGSQYGYGGLNPGGVINNHNPLDNISQLVSAFGTLPGVGSGTSNNGSTQ